MSKTSKHSRNAKELFNRELEKFAQSDIDHFVSGKYQLEQELEDQERRMIEEQSRYGQEMYELSLIDERDDDWDDDYYRYEDEADEYYEYDTDYLYDDYRDTWYIDDLNWNENDVGKYYKKENQTYLCVKVDGIITYVNVHTGQELRNRRGLKRA